MSSRRLVSNVKLGCSTGAELTTVEAIELPASMVNRGVGHEFTPENNAEWVLNVRKISTSSDLPRKFQDSRTAAASHITTQPSPSCPSL